MERVVLNAELDELEQVLQQQRVEYDQVQPENGFVREHMKEPVRCCKCWVDWGLVLDVCGYGYGSVGYTVHRRTAARHEPS